jgi:hypothetical protein
MFMPLQKRPNDLFISYGHADRDVVGPIVDWLGRSAGLKLWHDSRSGSAAQRTTDLLSRGIESARGAFFFLSPSWAASTWCKDEHEVALIQRRSNDEFLVLAGQIADVELPVWLQASQVLDLRRFDLPVAAALLRSLSPGPPQRLDNDQDVYYSGPWRNRSDAATSALRILQRTGWRLLTDSQDNRSFNDSVKRITAAIGSSRGLVAILPLRSGTEPHCTSRWVLDETRIAQQLGKPYLLLAEAGVVAPDNLIAGAYQGRVVPLSDSDSDSQLSAAVEGFDDVLAHTPLSRAGAYSFFAASLLGNPADRDALISVIEGATNMTCVQGQELVGQHAQEAIVGQIRDAAFVIADITQDNRNTLIECGIARGAGVPLHLLCALPADGNRKTRFMLQDMEINWYRDPLEQIGIVYKIARRHRRQVLAPTGQ